MNEWMNEWMNEGTNEWMNKRRNERMNEWTKERKKERKNKWMNERTNEYSNQSEMLSTMWTQEQTAATHRLRQVTMNCSQIKSCPNLGCSATWGPVIQ
jgi:C4-dicarboxylate-specific signal transduction histidine kinase